METFKLGIQRKLADMVITENLKFKGELKFEKLLKVNGAFEGRVVAPPNVSGYFNHK